MKEEFGLLEKSHEIGYDQKFKKHFSPDEKYKSLIQAESLLLDLEKQLFHSKLLSKFSTKALLAFATSNQTSKTSQNINEYSSLSSMEENEEHETSIKSDKNNNNIDDSLSIMINTDSEGEISDVDEDEIYENVDNNNPLPQLDVLSQYLVNRYTHENDACKKSDISNPILKSNLALLKLMCRYKLPFNAVKEFKERAHNSVKLKPDIFHLKPTSQETILI